MLLATLFLGMLGLALERALFGPLAVGGLRPDLLVVVMLLIAGRRRGIRLAQVAFVLGLLRDLVAMGPPGAYMLGYLAAALLVIELEGVVRLPSVAGATLTAASCGVLADVIASLVSMLSGPLVIGSPLALLGAGLYTGVAAISVAGQEERRWR